jgi:hypothetical protein
MVLGVALRVLRHYQDAEDVCQATFVLLAKKAHATVWRDSVGNWLYEVAGLGYNFYGFAMLVTRILKSRPHVIYERYALNTFCGVLVGRLFGIPHILEVNAPLLLEHKQLGKLAFKWVAAWSELIEFEIK